jgi:predicted nucleic acid-binding protein
VALVVLDASVIIAFLDSSDAHHEAAVAALATHPGEEFVLPASAYAEVLVGPCRRGAAAVASVEQFVADFAIRVEPVTAEIATRAAWLRARHQGLKLPDALVLATGDVLAATRVLTADRAWPAVSRRARSIESDRGP